MIGSRGEGGKSLKGVGEGWDELNGSTVRMIILAQVNLYATYSILIFRPFLLGAQKTWLNLTIFGFLEHIRICIYIYVWVRVLNFGQGSTKTRVNDSSQASC